MKTTKELVAHLLFDSDANVIGEYWSLQTVYRYPDGRIEINSLGRHVAYQCGEVVIAHNGQQMPCRASGFDVIKDIAASGAWVNTTGRRTVANNAKGKVPELSVPQIP